MKQQLLKIPGLSLEDKVQYSINVLREYEPKDRPYWGCFSGGKDSVVIKHLAGIAGINAEWVYNVTTIDPPELVYFIRDTHPDVKFKRPKRPLLSQIPKRGLPTRLARWCCADYKERQSPKGATHIIGVRAAESAKRAKTWKTITYHTRTRHYAVLPILYWTDDEIWEYIWGNKIAYCSLYDEGFKRLGCVGCPIASIENRKQEFARWPKYEQLWKRAALRLWDRRKDNPNWWGYVEFSSCGEMWDWWMREPYTPKDECGGLPNLFA